MIREKNNNPLIYNFSITACIAIATLLAIFSISGCGGEKKESSNPSFDRVKKSLSDLNVILITVDTLRADYLSCVKKGTAETPNIDKLAEEGVLFERCISQTPLTLPSHATILSGTYPLFHRVRDNGGFMVPDQLELVSEIIQKNGFATSAFIGAYVLHSKWGINQGFDHYSDAFDLTKYRTTTGELEKRADIVLGDAKKWIEKNKQKRFFSWIHLFDPHAPYEPPAPFDKKHEKNPYAGEVEYTDQQLGLFFQFLKDQGLYDKTLIIITADHGEGLWEHGERSHGFFVYETTVWVPLIFRAPERFPRQRVERLVELADIAPTILDGLGLDIPKSYQGQSLLPLTAPVENIEEHKKYSKKTAYSETFYSRLHLNCSELRTIYHNDLKYIRAPKEELYDMENDRPEKNNLAAQESENKKKTAIKRRLFKFLQDYSKNAVPIARLKLDKEEKKRLESLGYITADSSKTDGDGLKLPDPKDKLDFINTYEEARGMMEQEKYEEVLELTKKILVQDPDNVDTLIMRGVAFSKKGESLKAAEQFYRVLQLKPDYNDAMVNLVHVLIAAGDHETAISQAAKFLKIFPNDHSLYHLLGDAYYYKGDLENAKRYLQKSIDLESENSKVLYRLGEIHLQAKEFAEAEDYIKKALAVYENLQGAYYMLAEIKAAQNDTEAALSMYRKEMQIFPDSFPTALKLADMYMKKQDFAKGVAFYEKAIQLQPSFKMPYIMIARYYMESNQKPDEAIRLAKKGITIEPADELTLMGYFILTNIYSRKGDQAMMKHYSSLGEELYRKLEKEKQGL